MTALARPSSIPQARPLIRTGARYKKNCNSDSNNNPVVGRRCVPDIKKDSPTERR
jgi:hypothetical protein